VSNTPITSLPESIGNLTGLNILNLSDTPITSLPESIGNLSRLNIRGYDRQLSTPQEPGQEVEIPNVNVANQCNGDVDSPISLNPFEDGKTVILSDGKCYSFEDVVSLYRSNPNNFKSPFTRQAFTTNDINIAKTLIQRQPTQGGRKSKKTRKSRKSNKTRKSNKKSRKSKKTRKSKKKFI